MPANKRLKSLYLLPALGFVVASINFDGDRNIILQAIQSQGRLRLSGHKVRVAVLCDSDQHSDFERKLASRVSGDLISTTHICLGSLRNYEVLVVPGGSGSAKAAALGLSGKDEIRRFVHAGGGYIGICGGAFLATNGYDWSLGIVNVHTVTGFVNAGNGILKSMAARGAGAVKVRLTNQGRLLLDTNESVVSMQYSGGPIFKAGLGGCEGIGLVTLGCFESEVVDFEKQRGTMTGTPAMILSKFGSGRIILFSTHPEETANCENYVDLSVQAVANGE